MKEVKKGTKKKSSTTPPKKTTKKKVTNKKVTQTKKKVTEKKVTPAKKAVSNKKQIKRGFTLIELLAVIVILGLLMAIAIPAVTRYINQSRMKTLVSSINGYLDAATIAVNDNDFGSMSNQDNIYYIPVSNIKDDSCINLEKGGLDPYGNFVEAYVVVHYNASEYKYDYYFTFIDDAGYGMKLTKVDEIKSNGKGQIVNPSPVNPSTSDSNQITIQTIDDAVPHILGSDSCSAANSTVAGGFTPINPPINPPTGGGKFYVRRQINACTTKTFEFNMGRAKIKFSAWVETENNTDNWRIGPTGKVITGTDTRNFEIDGVTGDSYITTGKTYTTTNNGVLFPSIVCNDPVGS